MYILYSYCFICYAYFIYNAVIHYYKHMFDFCTQNCICTGLLLVFKTFVELAFKQMALEYLTQSARSD